MGAGKNGTTCMNLRGGAEATAFMDAPPRASRGLNPGKHETMAGQAA